MRRPRINLMIMTPGAPERPVRSYSLPGYFPRLALVAGVALAVILLCTSIMTVYYFRSIRLLETLQTENRSLREAMGQVTRLQAELNYHRDFTRRVAALLGISVPDFADSAGANMAGGNRSTGSGEPGGSASGSESEVASPGSLITGILVTNCPPDPNNRPHGLPVQGPLSRGFAPDAANPDLRHTGIDFAVREGAPVLATADGKVEYAGEDNLYGFLIVIDHGNGFKTMYGHNSVILIKTGDTVKRGDRIAFSGNTGVSTAPHLHYEIVENGRPIDPASFLGK